MSIAENLREIKNSLPEHVTLVAVSKTKPNESIQEAYEAGHRDFGENKVQEMTGKWEELPKDIRWHMIGHVQTNKVKYMAPFVHLIHGVDREKVLREVNKRAKNEDRQIRCTLQVHIAEESTKFGFDEKELAEAIENLLDGKYPSVIPVGLMGMATLTDDEKQIRKEFRHLKSLFDRYKNQFEEWNVLSMGMSADYGIAIEEGSTMVRIGSAIFGARN
jgi:hypothetical protein